MLAYMPNNGENFHTATIFQSLLPKNVLRPGVNRGSWDLVRLWNGKDYHWQLE